MRLALPFFPPLPEPHFLPSWIDFFLQRPSQITSLERGISLPKRELGSPDKGEKFGDIGISVWRSICRLLREFKLNFVCQTLANPSPPGSCYAMRKRKSRHKLHPKGEFLEREEGFFPSFEGDRERKE